MLPDPVHAVEGLGFPEALRWRDGELWFSDMFRGRVCRWRPGGAVQTVLAAADGGPEIPGGLGWLADGRLLVVDSLERRLLALGPGGVTVHAELADRMAHPANDLHVDPDGTAWVGGYGFDPERVERGIERPRPSRLLRVAPDGVVAEAAAELVFPNGCERAADGSLVVAETFADRVAILDPRAERRLREVRLRPGDGPDGLSIAPDGSVYVALAFVGAVVRIAGTDGGADGAVDGAVEPVYRAPAIPDGPGAGALGCYDCAVHPDGDRIAVACASLDESLAARVDTGRIVLLPLAPVPLAQLRRA
ncbi:MAG: SMP-30/gluconolactonase/LRE family protein [Microbacteriaceae bacterium]